MIALFLGLKGRYISGQTKYMDSALLNFTQGFALGCFVAALSGLRKKVSDLIFSDYIGF